MAGLYIHIPFCKQKCIYCDFYSINSKKTKDRFIEALILDLKTNKDFIPNNIKTIYFGGGTPSILSKDEITKIFDVIKENFNLDELIEVTFEANPEQLTKEYLDFLITTPINRLSVGIQSFDDNDLKTLSRIHNSYQAINAVKLAKKVGFSNISIDLMYNLPNMNIEKWKNNLKVAVELDIQHISAYSLSVEKGTILDKFIDKGKLYIPSEEEQLLEFNLCIDFLKEYGFNQYEISNYAKSGYKSVHNSNYWNEIPYLGVGPSAHSFNNKNRKWNVSNMDLYCNSLELGNKEYYEIEYLSDKDKYNEFIMLNIRQTKGIDICIIKEKFIDEVYNEFRKSAKRMIEAGLLEIQDSFYKPTRKGLELNNELIINLIQ